MARRAIWGSVQPDTSRVPAGTASPRSNSAAAIACYGDDGEALGRVVSELFGVERIVLSLPARAHLLELLGADRALSRSEIEKLALYVGPGVEATIEDIDAIVGDASGLVIDERDNMPSSAAYRGRFGSLLRAYTLVGYSPGRDYDYVEINRLLRAMHPQVVSDTIAAIEQAGGFVCEDPATGILTINDEFTVSVVISRSFRTPHGALRWKIRFDTSLRPDLTVALRMDTNNRTVLDYYVLPRIDVTAPNVRLAEENGLSLDAYRFESLDAFFLLAARAHLRTAA